MADGEAEKAPQTPIATSEIEYVDVAGRIAEQNLHDLARAPILLQRNAEILAEGGSGIAVVTQRMKQHLVAWMDTRVEGPRGCGGIDAGTVVQDDPPATVVPAHRVQLVEQGLFHLMHARSPSWHA